VAVAVLNQDYGNSRSIYTLLTRLIRLDNNFDQGLLFYTVTHLTMSLIDTIRTKNVKERPDQGWGELVYIYYDHCNNNKSSQR